MTDFVFPEPQAQGQNNLPAPDTRDRELAILHVLRQPDAQAGLSIRVVADMVKEYLVNGSPGSDNGKDFFPKHDNVSIQAYHKIINRLVTLGRIEEAEVTGGRGERLYRLAPYLHTANPISLDDIYEWAFQTGAHAQLPPSQVLARAADARDYLGEQKAKVLSQAAAALKQENPRELFFGMICHYFDVLKTSLELYNHYETREPETKARVEQAAVELDVVLYRMLGIPPEVVDITQVRHLINAPDDTTVQIDSALKIDKTALKGELERRVFGENFLNLVPAGETRGGNKRKRVTVAGSDGSTHASVLQVRSAPNYNDEDAMVVTFNNAMVYVQQDSYIPNKAQWPFHSVPITRAALDDPTNRGMILARQMFPNLEESEYTHMAKCATDVIQWRVDDNVFKGGAPSITPANITTGMNDPTLPAPSVHFRDGTVVPQEREFGHYRRLDAYGSMVREGQNRMRSILERIRSEGNKQVFAGAVKTTQMRVFSKALSWYVSHGSKNRPGSDGQAIDPAWEEKFAAGYSDNLTMTYLLSSLVNQNKEQAKEGNYWVTCVVRRPFHATTEFHRQSGVTTDNGWKTFFDQLAAREEAFGKLSNQSWLWESTDWESDDFVYLCKRADFCMFYIGHTAGDPPPSLPRYEFLDSLKFDDVYDTKARVERNVRSIVEALDHTGFSTDSDHNLFTNKRVIKYLPHVIHRAHEVGKSVGRQLESELRATVLSYLKILRNLRGITVNDISFIPVNLRAYLERMTQDIRKEEDDEPGRWLR